MAPEAWDLAVTSCLRPAARSSGPTTISTQRLAEYETLKRTFHIAGNRCHQSDSARNLVTWISQRLSTTSLRTASDINLELAQRISVSLHRDFARAVLLPADSLAEVSDADTLTTTMTCPTQ